ncbi:MAG: SRPBCC domain-containing protein [Eudoraea sp.]|nr:SRPBCC domain-containing protein [Eudoraea sp.]
MNHPENRTLTLERNFDAPLQLVWEAWTQAEHIAQWWGPKGMETEVIEHNFTEGGSWKYVMTMPDRNKFIGEGVYKEIIPLKKIVTSANFKPMTEGVELHIQFEEFGSTTHFIFQVVHETEAYCKQQEEMGFYNGWASTFDRLNEHLLQHRNK